MSQDIVADILNQIMNTKMSGRDTLVITRFNKLLIKVLEMMKNYGYLEYEINKSTYQ